MDPRCPALLFVFLLLILDVHCLSYRTNAQRRARNLHPRVHNDEADIEAEDDVNERSKEHGVSEHVRRPHPSNHGRARPSQRSKDAAVQDVKKANEHYLTVRAQARCKQPRPKLVKVKDVYPDTTREFLPRCTILHLCGDDSGCCDHDTMQCVAKETHTVELHFYTLHLSADGGGVHSGNTVEKLSFTNHTECECQIVNERPRVSLSGPHQRSRCPGCPSEFSVRELDSGGCACDCFDKQKTCLRLKRGRDLLNDIDRRCVESAHCNPPECEYGLYDVTIGRCPRKNERGKGQHTSHWWKVEERD